MRTGSCGVGASVKQAARLESSCVGGRSRLGSYQTAAWKDLTCPVVRRTSRTACLKTGWMRGRALRKLTVFPFLCITPRKEIGHGSIVKRSLVGRQQVTTLIPCGLRSRRRMARGWGRTARAARTNTRIPCHMTGRKIQAINCVRLLRSWIQTTVGPGLWESGLRTSKQLL